MAGTITSPAVSENRNFPTQQTNFLTLYSCFLCVCVVVCVFQCQSTALLRASGSAQDGYMALSVVYFRITHRLGRPHYVWDEYLYSVRVKVEVGVIVNVTVCVVLLCFVG